MLRDHVRTSRDSLGSASDSAGRFLGGANTNVSLSDLRLGSSLGGRLRELAGRSVLVATRDQLAAALALIELDGVAHRLIICPPDVSSDHLPAVIRKAGVNAIVSDHDLDRKSTRLNSSH